MSAQIWLFYDGWGMLELAIFLSGYAIAFFLSLRHRPTAEFIAKLFGFGGLIALFVTSGWLGGLVGFGFGIGLACVLLMLFRPARKTGVSRAS
jgi:hypothetical protein